MTDGGQQKVPIVFRSNGYDGNYGETCDPGPYPATLHAPVEGNGLGDAHVLIVDKYNDLLYELYHASLNGHHWEAPSGAGIRLKAGFDVSAFPKIYQVILQALKKWINPGRYRQ